MPVEIDLLHVEGEDDARVIRAVVTGQLEEADFRELGPRIDELLEQHASLRLLVQLSDFAGWSVGGAWQEAKLGIRTLTSIERLAIIGDQHAEAWMTRLAAPFSLAEVRFFEPFETEKALSWISEAVHARIDLSVEESRRIVRLRPRGRLTQDDFVQLSGQVDPLIKRWGDLNGLVIESDDFPGWESLGALIHHVRFMSGHHRKIRRIALVTDSPLGAIAERAASHFVAARVKQFDAEDLDLALQWAAKHDTPELDQPPA